MIDVDGQEAARVVVGVEEQELLVAVHRIAGVVDIQRDSGGRAGKERQKRSNGGGVIRATSMRDGASSANGSVFTTPSGRTRRLAGERLPRQPHAWASG